MKKAMLMMLAALAMLAGAAMEGAAETFTNPVIAADWPDPSIYTEGDGVFYSVATELKTIRSSTNLVDWTDTRIDPLTAPARAKLLSISRNLWAPCVVKLQGRWVLYISQFINDRDCRVEVLVSKSPTGPFEYVREIVNSLEIGIMNTIDPYVLEADGKVWMFVGSCADGIHRVELAADGLTVQPGAKYVHVAGRRNPGRCIWGQPGAWEGSYLLNRRGWWYLFMSGGIYSNHTYHMVVGRSRKIDGEFFDHEGNPLTRALAKPMLMSDKGDKFYGPGHNGEVFTSADGRDYMFYHCHDTAFPRNWRPTMLQELHWSADDWPYFERDRPKHHERSFRLPAPVKAGATDGPRRLKVACIGDSITYGLGLEDRAHACYPAQLQTLLNARFPGVYEVRNFGSSGRGVYLDSMRGAEKRGFRFMREHAAALAWKPDVVICNLGINDCGEYIKEYTGGRERGKFVRDYIALLSDYRNANPQVKFYLWTKLAPLLQGQRFHRSPEPFLMQTDLDRVARQFDAIGIDMQEPLRERMDELFARDRIHPTAAGAKVIAEATFKAMTAPRELPVTLPKANGGQEVWLCAGQSNMQQGWGAYNRTPEEKARVKAELAQLDQVDVRFWDFNDGSWKRLTRGNALAKSANGVSFAIRRALKTGRQICILYVAAGGAPTEAFLSEQTLCAVGSDGKPLYPRLSAIATNRHQLQHNADFPCKWCAREYPRRKGNREEAYWWPVSKMYDAGIRRIRELPLTGIYWYQGESNATLNLAPDRPLAADYIEETLRAVVHELRGGRDIPFLMMGLPRMNRPWEPYRAAQRKVCAETGAVYLDSFGAGLGDPNDVHPRNKIPFAELASQAVF